MLGAMIGYWKGKRFLPKLRKIIKPDSIERREK